MACLQLAGHRDRTGHAGTIVTPYRRDTGTGRTHPYRGVPMSHGLSRFVLWGIVGSSGYCSSTPPAVLTRAREGQSRQISMGRKRTVR